MQVKYHLWLNRTKHEHTDNLVFISPIDNEPIDYKSDIYENLEKDIYTQIESIL